MFRELKADTNCQYVLSAKDNEPLSPTHGLRRSFCTQLDETLHIDPVVIEKRNEMLVQHTME
ncbi:MAG: hypothetical protein LCH30_10300 [Proteobacteria bacterium]|nr:hypothetical protein [Pseudomonadota bacterium]